MRVHNASVSSILLIKFRIKFFILCLFVLIYLCDVSINDFPFSRILFKQFHRKRRVRGSIPLVGSSKRTICGLPISEIATDNLRLLPPDNVCTYEKK